MFRETIESHYNKMSKKQQLVANFVLQKPAFVSTHTAKEVGEHSNTSETTVLRFCTTIGLEGYASLQKKLTLYLLHEKRQVNSLHSYIAASKEQLLAVDSIYQDSMIKDIESLQKMIHTMDERMFRDACEKLHKAKDIYVLGLDASKYAANWLLFTLSLLRPNVYEFPTETHAMIRTLQKLNDKSIVIVISQHRYAKETIEIVEGLRNEQIQMIGITDSNISPIHSYVPFTFVLEQIEQSTIHLMPLLTSFINALVTGMTSYDPSYYEERSINFDQVEQQFILKKWS